MLLQSVSLQVVTAEIYSYYTICYMNMNCECVSMSLQVVVPYLAATISKEKAEKVALDVLAHFFKEMQEKTRVTEELEEGEDLCDCEFSLAYGKHENNTMQQLLSNQQVIVWYVCTASLLGGAGL